MYFHLHRNSKNLEEFNEQDKESAINNKTMNYKKLKIGYSVTN